MKHKQRFGLLVASIFVLGATSLATIGCGSSDGELAKELAKQRDIDEAKKQASKDAKQSAKIQQLQQELKREKDSGSSATSMESSSGDTATPSPGGNGTDDWPGGSAYTAILASLGSRNEAIEFQARARNAGLDAGILFSSDYGSLRPGYWVVFSGTYDSSDGAARRVSYANSLGYGDAYPRFVAP